jgi:glycosyltransferase involved in cell wall biosynthesis
MFEHPLCIIAIPAYNEERFILEALKSVQSQTIADFKAVISDNASTDGTYDICKEFCAGDDRFVCVRQPENIGSSANFQWLLDNTGSKYFAMLGSHDMLHPQFVEKHLKAMEADQTLALSYANTRCVNESSEFIENRDGGKPHRIADTPAQRYRATFWRPGAGEAINSFFRRDALKGSYTWPVASPDKVVLCHAAYWGPFKKIDEILYIRRVLLARTNSAEAKMRRITGKPNSRRSRMEPIRIFRKEFASLERSRLERFFLDVMLCTRLARQYKTDLIRWLTGRY